MRVFLTLALLSISACASEVATEADEFVDVDDVGVAAEALTYTSINSNNGQALTAGTTSHKRMCLRAYVMANGSTASNFWTCPNNQDYCEPTIQNQAETQRIGSCFDMVLGSWDRVCPITTNSNTVPIGMVTYKQTGNTCGFWRDLNPDSLRGNATLSPARADWPPSVAQPSCRMDSHPCAAGGGIGVGGGICVTRVCS